MGAMLVYGPESSSAPFAAPSPNIWGQMPSTAAMQDPAVGFLLHEDFDFFPVNLTNTTLPLGNGWRGFLSNGATILDAGIANVGAVTILSDGDEEAAMFIGGTAPIRITKDSGRKVAFEARFKTSTIADTKHGLFFGLMETLAPSATALMADAGTLADVNFIGFHRLEGDGDKLDVVFKADGQTQQSFTDADTLVADTFVKVGLLFDGKQTLKFFFDGQEYATAQLDAADLDAATFPDDINLTPVFAIKNATGSTPGSATIDWIRFGFTRNYDDGIA